MRIGRTGARGRTRRSRPIDAARCLNDPFGALLVLSLLVNVVLAGSSGRGVLGGAIFRVDACALADAHHGLLLEGRR